MDRMDIEVSLTSLVGARSPPPSPEHSHPATRPQTLAQQHIRAESSGSVSTKSITSPCPAKGLRTSLVRYSQDHSRVQPRRPTSAQSYSSESDFDRSASPVQDLTSSSLAQSSRSTNLSISSLNSSPCPGPRQRRVPMLTRNPPPLPNFRFPAPKAAKPAPWTKTSTTPEKGGTVAKADSPFKKAFNPLEQFRRKSQKKSSGSEEVTANLDIQVMEAASAFLLSRECEVGTDFSPSQWLLPLDSFAPSSLRSKASSDLVPCPSAPTATRSSLPTLLLLPPPPPPTTPRAPANPPLVLFEALSRSNANRTLPPSASASRDTFEPSRALRASSRLR